mgnify:FL=1
MALSFHQKSSKYCVPHYFSSNLETTCSLEFRDKLYGKMNFPHFDPQARKVEYKDTAEEEWEKFQKAMQVESQVSKHGQAKPNRHTQLLHCSHEFAVDNY